MTNRPHFVPSSLTRSSVLSNECSDKEDAQQQSFTFHASILQKSQRWPSPPFLLGQFHPRVVPIQGKVYYLPDGKHVPPSSIVHAQKRQDGFFKHPVLVVSVDKIYAWFYSLTRVPPVAIRELRMCLRLGDKSDDEGPEVLKLAEGSSPMHSETWINLEQRFKIEMEYLAHWSVDVKVDKVEKAKLQARIDWLESKQNRFIYKPIERDMRSILPGTVVLLPNPRGAPTLGAPVVVLENQYPRFRFLRIKTFGASNIFTEPLQEQFTRARRNCLAITRDLRPGHDGTPVMLLEHGSPDLREPSYIELSRKQKWGRLDHCKTWCYPSVRIQSWSLKLLLEYLSQLPEPATGPRAQQNMGYDPYTHVRPQIWDELLQGQAVVGTNGVEHGASTSSSHSSAENGPCAYVVRSSSDSSASSGDLGMLLGHR